MKFDVLGFTWEVVVSRLEDVNLWGYTDPTPQILYINETIHPQRLYSTVVHEVAHVYIQSTAFDQVDFNKEIMCDFFGLYGSDIIATSNKIATFIEQKLSGKERLLVANYTSI